MNRGAALDAVHGLEIDMKKEVGPTRQESDPPGEGEASFRAGASISSNQEKRGEGTECHPCPRV